MTVFSGTFTQIKNFSAANPSEFLNQGCFYKENPGDFLWNKQMFVKIYQQIALLVYYVLT